MSTISLYAIIAVLVVVVAVLLLRPRSEDPAAGAACARGLWDASGWMLAERIFDSADYLWLRNELGFPHLAKALARSRQRLAIKWLQALRRSFDELVRTPEPVARGAAAANAPDSWELLRLTLRFHLILSYAFVIVRYFGPYHSLVPSFGWMHSLPPQVEEFGRAHTARRT